MRRHVVRKLSAKRLNEKPARSAVTTHASSTPVPVADSQLNVKTARSAVFSGTIGGTRTTALCNIGTSTRYVAFTGPNVAAFRAALTDGQPHARTNTPRIRNGIHPYSTSLPVYVTFAPATPFSSSKRKIVRG